MCRISAVAVPILLLISSSLSAQPAAATAAANDSAVKLEQVDVTASAETQLNTIDRKIYNVGNSIQATTGSAADVLQNIPSVQVDIDGNVSLRGDTSVQILIDGRSSALMGAASRADVLSQFPADSIERIEVITNPSAKYKPDGSGGIINLVLKTKRAKGSSGSVHATVGNDRRYGLSLNGNLNPGPYNLFGSYAIRQDDRPRVQTARGRGFQLSHFRSPWDRTRRSGEQRRSGHLRLSAAALRSGARRQCAVQIDLRT